jgi:hypothetical protein
MPPAKRNPTGLLVYCGFRTAQTFDLPLAVELGQLVGKDDGYQIAAIAGTYSTAIADSVARSERERLPSGTPMHHFMLAKISTASLMAFPFLAKATSGAALTAQDIEAWDLFLKIVGLAHARLEQDSAMVRLHEWLTDLMAEIDNLGT